MAQVSCYEIIMYEVKIANKPIREFYTEEAALEFIAEHKDEFVFMRKLENAIIEL